MIRSGGDPASSHRHTATPGTSTRRPAIARPLRSFLAAQAREFVRPNYLAKTGRSAEIAVGLILGLCAVSLLAAGVVGVLAFLRNQDHKIANNIVSTVFLVVGTGISVFAWRLVLGRGRQRDGGLVSPTTLRAAGVVFLVSPLIALFSKRWDTLLGLLHIGFSAACFELARRRETRLQPDRSDAKGL